MLRPAVAGDGDGGGGGGGVESHVEICPCTRKR